MSVAPPPLLVGAGDDGCKDDCVTHHLKAPGIHIFTPDWCLHCERMKEEHDNNKGNTDIHIHEHEEKTITPDELKTNGYDTEGLTIYFVKEDVSEIRKYEGPKDYQSLIAAYDAYINLKAPGIHLFTAVWCGHCRRMKEEHDSDENEECKGTTNIRIYEHEENMITQDELEKNGYGIEGYPTIYFVKEGGKDKLELREYRGPRDYKSLIEAYDRKEFWLETV